jgi:hypothetical protein
MSWMNTTLDVNNVLPFIYPYVIHITDAPYFLTPEYKVFMSRMLHAQNQAPFYSNLYNISQVTSVRAFIRQN